MFCTHWYCTWFKVSTSLYSLHKMTAKSELTETIIATSLLRAMAWQKLKRETCFNRKIKACTISLGQFKYHWNDWNKVLFFTIKFYRFKKVNICQENHLFVSFFLKYPSFYFRLSFFFHYNYFIIFAKSVTLVISGY